MKRGFVGGVIIGAVMGATVSIMAEENFNMNRSAKAMKRAGRNIGKCAGRAYKTMCHMI